MRGGNAAATTETDPGRGDVAEPVVAALSEGPSGAVDRNATDHEVVTHVAPPIADAQRADEAAEPVIVPASTSSRNEPSHLPEVPRDSQDAGTMPAATSGPEGVRGG